MVSVDKSEYPLLPAQIRAPSAVQGTVANFLDLILEILRMVLTLRYGHLLQKWNTFRVSNILTPLRPQFQNMQIPKTDRQEMYNEGGAIGWMAKRAQMEQPVRVGVIGDFDSERPSHVATNEALGHASGALGLALDVSWVPTAEIDRGRSPIGLKSFDAFFCSPGSPYGSMEGALAGIRFAREYRRPFIGT